MAVCKYCGSQIPDGSKFCPECGAPCQESAAPVQTGSAYIPTPVNSPVNTPVEAEPALPMTWHNFLTVVLIIGGIFNILYGITYLFGGQYARQGTSADLVYSVFPAIKTCDLIYGICTIGLGVFMFYVRNRLHGFCQNGPAMLLRMYGISLILGILYAVCVSAIIGQSAFDASSVGPIIATLILIFANRTYYAKRAALFVN